MAQSKPTQTNWYSIKSYDITWFKEGSIGELSIKDPKWYVKNTCNVEDIFKGKNSLEKQWGPNSYATITDEVVDSDGKVLVAYISIKRRSFGMVDKFFYREKSQCLEKQEELKNWVTDRNTEFEKERSKYK
jgi:hypothetical protein